MIFERAIRKAMQTFWRWQRPMTLGARGIVVDGQGRVLLVRQTYAKGWIFPGGGVEPRETIATSMARELDEEAGVGVIGTPELLGIYSNEAVFPGDHVAVYVIRQWRQLRPMVPNREIAELGFFAIDALPDGTTDGTRCRIEEMHGQRPRRELW